MLPDKLRLKLEDRSLAGSLRSLKTTDGLIDFASNDYLGFSKSLHVSAGTSTGSTGSRLLSGNTALHEMVEDEIAAFHKSAKAILFNSGYDANVGLLPAVTDRHDVILYDDLIHASLRDGIQLSQARNIKYAHNNIQQLEKLIERHVPATPHNLFIVTESVFSMDGDSPDLQAIIAFRKQYKNVHIILDEAHAVGVIGSDGAGLAQYFNVQDAIFARVVTFGKALGSHGAAVLCCTNTYVYLMNYARSFIYTTAMPAYSLRAISAGYDALINRPDTIKRLKDIIAAFNLCLVTLGLKSRFRESETAIHTCIIPGNVVVHKVATSLQQNGYDVRPILSPTVATGTERLRICLHSYNSIAEIENMLTLLAQLILKT